MVKLQALGNMVIVQPLKKETKTASGIYVPETAQQVSCEGVVIAANEFFMTEKGVKVPSEVQVGDIVMYDNRGVAPTEIDGGEYLFVHVEALLAKRTEG